MRMSERQPKRNDAVKWFLTELICCFLVLITVSACDPSPIDSKNRRVELAKENKGDIVVGVAWAFKNDAFVKGAQLAVEEENSHAEGLFKKRKFKLVQRDDTYRKSKNGSIVLERNRERAVVTGVAHAFVADPSVIAVIGHRSSLAAIPASITYQHHGVVFLAPTATNLELTNHQFEYVFRLIPSNEQIGKQLVKFCVNAGYKSMAVLYARDTYAEESSKAFMGNTVAYEGNTRVELINIVFARSFFASKGEFSAILADLKEIEQSIDAIFVATTADSAGKLIKQIRGMAIQLPIVGVDAMHSKELWSSSGGKAQGTVVPAVLDDEKEQEFFQKYNAHYPDEQPDYRAILGYDAIHLLARAMKKANTTVPITIATAIRYMPPLQGVIGRYKFDQYGNLVGRDLYFKALCNGEFKMIQMDAGGKYKIENCESPMTGGGIQDKDNDGIPDKGDVCPDNTAEEISESVFQEGSKKGCPIDTDGDGVSDYLDKCQTVSQLENLKGVDEKGCPVDLDQDGMPDYEDECLQTPVDIEVNNQGCPLVEELGTYKLFSSTETLFSGNTLTEQGKKTLEEMYTEHFDNKIPKDYVGKIEIVGYTDNRGSEEYNLKVSEARAKYVADYFIAKGIGTGKITVRGNGKEQPVKTNETDEGRASNRRVEIKVSVLKKKKIVDKEEKIPEPVP